jgi:hypothetical protein
MLLITENMMMGSDCVILFQVSIREAKFTKSSLLFYFVRFCVKFVGIVRHTFPLSSGFANSNVCLQGAYFWQIM